jgi:hypothetical protein
MSKWVPASVGDCPNRKGQLDWTMISRGEEMQLGYLPSKLMGFDDIPSDFLLCKSDSPHSASKPYYSRRP